MVIENNKNDVVITGDVKENEVRIDNENLDHILTLLSSNLYSNPQESFIREIVSNGIDATIEAGNNEPVIVKFSYDNNSYKYIVTIRDYGTGISPERFQEIYLSIGASTKRLSNKYIGAFGLGKYSCLACSSSATIKSYYNGIEYCYLMIKNNNKINIDLLYQHETTERNGVEISILQDRLYSYCAAIKKLLYFPNVYVDSLDSSSVHNDDLRNTIEWLHNRKIVKAKNFYLGYTDRTTNVTIDTSSYNPYLVLGNVIYAYDCEYIKNNAIHDLKKISSNIDGYDVERLLRSINLRFDIGELDITPNREQLLYSDKTNKALLNRFWDAYDELKETLKKSEDCNYDNLIEYYHKIVSLGSIKFDRYSVPSLIISGSNNRTEFKFKGKQRSEQFNQNLRSLFNFPMYYNVIRDNKFYNGGKVKKSETLTPYEIFVSKKLGDNVKIYLCSSEDLKSPSFKNYISCTLHNGIIITPITIRQLFSHSRVFDIEVLKEIWRYLKDHAIRVTKDEYYNDYLKARKNYKTALKNVNANNNVNIRVTIALYRYNGYRESTNTYPLNKFTNYVNEYKIRNKSNKDGIIIYCCLEDECFKVLRILSRDILGNNVHVVAIPKAHYKYVENNKPKNWVHLSKIINPNNKKIVKTFTYIKYGIAEKMMCLNENLYHMFLNYVNFSDQSVLNTLTKKDMIFHKTDIDNNEILHNWYQYFLENGTDDIEVLEQKEIIDKYVKIARKLGSLRNLFTDGSIMLAYIAMKNGLLRLNYGAYKKIKDNLKIDKDEDNKE